MLPTRAAGAGCLLRALRAYLLFVLACVVVAVGLGYLAAGRAVRRAEQAWAERAEPMELASPIPRLLGHRQLQSLLLAVRSPPPLAGARRRWRGPSKPASS
jgi:hypothetical protein